jgi:hypothetical protein
MSCAASVNLNLSGVTPRSDCFGKPFDCLTSWPNWWRVSDNGINGDHTLPRVSNTDGYCIPSDSCMWLFDSVTNDLKADFYNPDCGTFYGSYDQPAQYILAKIHGLWYLTVRSPPGFLDAVIFYAEDFNPSAPISNQCSNSPWVQPSNPLWCAYGCGVDDFNTINEKWGVASGGTAALTF